MSIIGNLLGYAAYAGISKTSEAVNNRIVKANRPCTFSGIISDYEFNALVRNKAKECGDIYELNIVGSVVSGKINGELFGGKQFNINFNDHGRLTGVYKITGCKDNVVIDFADAISDGIQSFKEGYEKISEQQIKEEEDRYFKSCCPYCNKNVSADSKHCPYCGKLLRI